MLAQPDFHRVDETVLKAVREGAFPSACVLVGLGKRVLHRRAYGCLSVEPDSPRTSENTRYDLASMTKPLVTAMITLRALEAGKLCLWDRLDTFLDCPPDKGEITIGQLLTHTAGFANGIHMWKQLSRPEESSGLLLNMPLKYRPGEQVQYCCAGYILLGQLLECLYGLPLDELAAQEVFWPLHMRDTGFLPSGGNIAATERMPDGRCLTGIVHDENARFLGGVAGNAGVFSTMDDLLLFVQMLAARGMLPDGSAYLSAPTVRMALSNQTPGMTEARGLGFVLPGLNNGYGGDLFPACSAGHTGFTGTSFLLDPSTGFYVILLTNRICPSRENTAIYRVRRLVHNAAYAAAAPLMEEMNREI